MPMNNRILRPLASGVHPDAAAWRSAVVANGGSVSASTMRAVSTFCAAIDAAGIRDRFYRLNLFAGNSDASLNAVRTPLYRGPSLGGTQYGNALDTNNNFVAGDYAETGASGGLLGNGSSKYLNTGLQTDALPDPAIGHLSAYVTGQTSSRAGWISAFGAGFVNASQVEYNADGNTFRSWGREQLLATTPGTVDHLLVTRGGTTDQRAYDDGALVNTTTTLTTMAGSSAALTVLARNVDGSVGAYSDGRVSFYSIGDNVSTAQVSSFYAALLAFQQALGRA
jgi:hypothetical protein